jgi:hypothetical protein
MVNRNANEPLSDQSRRLQLARWGVLIFALCCTLVAVITCRYRFVGSIGPLRFRVSNPLKSIALAICALQLWCVLSPRLDYIARRASRFSLVQLWLLAMTIETGILAAIGVVVIDLQWGWAAAALIAKPRLSATAAFCFTAAFLLSINHNWRQLRAMASRLLILWRRWSWAARAVFLMVLIHALGVTKVLLGYWEQTSTLFLTHQSARAPQLGRTRKWDSTFDRFCDECRQLIPPDAAVLYRGPTEGLVMTYELYPRKVFMLPSEQRALFHDGWCTDLWCRGMAPDPLDDYWKWDPLLPDMTEQEFIERHGITHVVTYDNTENTNCTIQSLQSCSP